MLTCWRAIRPELGEFLSKRCAISARARASVRRRHSLLLIVSPIYATCSQRVAGATVKVELEFNQAAIKARTRRNVAQ